jgi:hypothetical protein
MRGSLLAALFVVPALFACSSVLGYDDVSFEGETGGANAGGSSGAGVGGAGGSPVGGSSGGPGCTNPDCSACGACFERCFCQTGDANGCTAACGPPAGGAGGAPGTGGSGTGGSGTGGSGTGGSGTGGSGTGGSGTGGSGTGGSGTGGSGTGGSGTGGTGGGSTDACTRWNSDRASLSEGTWSGSIAGCNPGDISADGRANALKLVNLYRFLAGLPAVTNDAGRDQAAQACALMMDANDDLSHSPPSSWTCYTQTGADAAGSSNIASTSGVTGVDLYMADPGNPTTIGHRRWILSNSLGPIGLGTTSDASCMYVIGGSGSAGKQWVAWPPPGVVPLGVFNASYQTLDETGWTVQSDSVDLAAAQVSVRDGGTDVPVSTTQLQGGYGSRDAIRFNPQGWTTQAGHTYSVTVSGVTPAIQYDVQVVACN